MKLIESKVEFIPQEKGLKGIYKMIELAARTAYQSQDKIGTGAQDFVNRMIKSKHYATLEHGTVYLKMPYDTIYDDNPYSNSLWDGQDMFVTTNYRVLQENEWLDDLKYICDPTDQHEKRYTFRFTTDIGICRELLRHRKFSFLNESTRYCNYSKGKFGGEITFIRPSWYDKYSNSLLNNDGYRPDKTSDMFTSEGDFEDQLRMAESCYMAAMIAGVTPQEARQVLPLATKTELIMTGFSSDWRYLLDLRLYNKTGKSHPDMVNLMEKLRFEALEAGIWHDIMKYPSKFK